MTLKMRHSRNEPSPHDSNLRYSTNQPFDAGMMAYMKTRTEDQDWRTRQQTLYMREYERNAYPPKRHFEKTALLYSTHKKPQYLKGTWGTQGASTPASVDPLHFNKTLCNETRYLNHLKDTHVVHIMRSNKEYSMAK